MAMVWQIGERHGRQLESGTVQIESSTFNLHSPCYAKGSMIERTIRPVLEELFQQYPVVTVTGPRQAGKTTLCREVFPNLEYINLERPDIRQRAIDDPRSFLDRYAEGAIFDEIQRAPELVSYLQVLIDERRRPGQFVLTGSQHFLIANTISQSLAGRTGLLRLLPLSIEEVASAGANLETDTLLHTGFYPRLYDTPLEPTRAHGDYFETYVERDIRQLGEIRNLTAFQRFVRLCAGRTGQLLNYSKLGNDAGVSHATVREWFSLLEASYVTFQLPPFHTNISKRLIKTPKLYFYDVGLAAYLLGIEESAQLFSHPMRGALFENLVVVEALKYRFNQGKRSNLFFYRDGKGDEVDLLYTLANRFVSIEIKSGATLAQGFFRGLQRLRKFLPEHVAAEMLVHDGEGSHTQHGTRVTVPAEFVRELRELENLELSGKG